MAIDEILSTGVGNALAQGAHAGYFAGRGRLEQQEEQRRQAAQPYIGAAMGGDQDALAKLAAGDAKTASTVIQNLGRLDTQKRAHVKEVADYTSRAANAILQANPAERPAIYKQMIEQGKAQGYDLSGMPQEYSPAIDGQLRSHRAMAIPVLEHFKQEELMRRHLTPGATQTPSMEPLNGPTAPPGPVSDAGPVAAPPVQTAAVAPPQAPPQGVQPQPVQAPPLAPPQMAQAPEPDRAALGAPPDLKEPPPAQQGAIWTTDPATQGGQMMGHRAKPGAPLMPAEVGGHFVYRLPNGQTVLYKPQAEKSQLTDVLGPDGKTLIGQRDPRTNQYHPINQAAPSDAIDPSLRGEELLQSLPPSEAAQVRAVVEGRAPLPSLSARMAPEAKRLRQLAFQLDPSFDATVYASRQKTQNDMADGKLATNRTNAIKLIGHMGELHAVSDELNNSDTPLFNAAGNLIAANRGDPRISKFEVTKQLVLEEADKFFSGTGGTTVSGMEDWKKKINAAQSPQQLQGVMTQITKLLNSQIDAMADQFNSGMKYTGDKKVAPESLLSDSARAALQRINGSPLKGPAERARDTFNATNGPKPGVVEQGYRFKGGDPSKQENWEPAQ